MSKTARNLLLAIVLGYVTGVLLGPKAKPLDQFGFATIRFLKTLATPLLFFGVVETFCKTQIQLKDAARLILISTLNAAMALLLALTIAHLFPIEHWLNLSEIQKFLPPMKPPATLPSPGWEGFVPSHILQPFQENNVIGIVFLGVIVGLALRALSLEQESVMSRFFSEAYRIVHQVLHWVVQLIPFALFCILASLSGSQGFALFPALGVFITLVMLGMLIQVFAYYGLLLRGIGVSLGPFFKDSSDALLTALSTGSSLATLPVTLNTLQERRKIPAKYSRLAAAIGTNLNHDGIILYEAMAALFIARLYGIPLSVQQQAIIAGTSILAAIGIAGVPDAGLITLSLVLHAAGLPVEAVAMLLPVDWLIGRFRATTNVASDLTTAHLLSWIGWNQKD